MKFSKGFKHFTGKIEALGQSVFNSDRHIYSYIRVLDSQGNVLNIKDVTVSNIVDSYIQPGIEAKFYTYDYAGGKWLFGIETNGRKVVDDDLAKKYDGSCTIQTTCMVIFTALSVIFATFEPVPMYGVLGALLFGFLTYKSIGFKKKSDSKAMKKYVEQGGSAG